MSVFTFGVAATVLPPLAIPGETRGLGMSLQSAAGGTSLVSVSVDNYAFNWTLTSPCSLNRINSRSEADFQREARHASQ